MRTPKHDGSQVIIWTENGVEKRCIPSPNHTIESVVARVVPAGVKWRVKQAGAHGRAQWYYQPVEAGRGIDLEPLDENATLPQAVAKINDLVHALSVEPVTHGGSQSSS